MMPGEQWIHFARASKAAATATSFFARCVALTWGDTYLDDGLAFPGLLTLEPADLDTVAYQAIRADAVNGAFQESSGDFLDEGAGILRALGYEVRVPTSRAVLKTLLLHDSWNNRRFMYELFDEWLFLEWSTTA